MGSNAASNAADGSYLISLDLNGNVSLETTQRFWRLLGGEVNGDNVVDKTDTVIVNTKPNKNGKVNSTNVTYVKNPQTVNLDLILGVIQGASQSMAKLSGSVLGARIGVRANHRMPEYCSFSSGTVTNCQVKHSDHNATK